VYLASSRESKVGKVGMCNGSSSRECNEPPLVGTRPANLPLFVKFLSLSQSYAGISWSTWMVSISILWAPFWFNPQTFQVCGRSRRHRSVGLQRGSRSRPVALLSSGRGWWPFLYGTAPASCHGAGGCKLCWCPTSLAAPAPSSTAGALQGRL